MSLPEFREQLDAVDKQILELIAHRNQIVKEVGLYKLAHDLPVYHPDREDDMLMERKRQAQELGVSDECTSHVFKALIIESRDIQSQLKQ